MLLLLRGRVIRYSAKVNQARLFRQGEGLTQRLFPLSFSAFFTTQPPHNAIMDIDKALDEFIVDKRKSGRGPRGGGGQRGGGEGGRGRGGFRRGGPTPYEVGFFQDEGERGES